MTQCTFPFSYPDELFLPLNIATEAHSPPVSPARRPIFSNPPQGAPASFSGKAHRQRLKVLWRIERLSRERGETYCKDAYLAGLLKMGVSTFRRHRAWLVAEGWVTLRHGRQHFAYSKLTEEGRRQLAQSEADRAKLRGQASRLKRKTEHFKPQIEHSYIDSGKTLKDSMYSAAEQYRKNWREIRERETEQLKFLAYQKEKALAAERDQREKRAREDKAGQEWLASELRRRLMG